jgi:triosephosphate isomerase
MRALVAANWKMHKTLKEAEDYLRRLLKLVPPDPPVELAVFPSFTALALASEMLSGSPIALGAQNGHPEREGAFTGEVSMHQLADLGVRYVICGHSERRKIFGETDEFVAAKVRAAWAYGITPILCVGETLEERRAGKAWEVVERQLSVALERGAFRPACDRVRASLGHRYRCSRSSQGCPGDGPADPRLAFRAFSERKGKKCGSNTEAR